MDCPSEERLIRMALAPVEGIGGMRFDLGARTVTIEHQGPVAEVLAHLEPLGLGARLEEGDVGEPVPDDSGDETVVLQQVLVINAAMFVVELGAGIRAQSTGLIADSLDMLADAMVYGLALRAVGRGALDQRRAARTSGWIQLLLAVGVVAEVGRRAVVGSEPVEGLMMAVAAVALAANLACVALLSRHREGGVHLRASWIFTTTDALANLGVILAGLGVLVTGSPVPDLVVGTAVGLLVLWGAVRILRL
ncbi:MAG: cation transporter [Myxococcales bacterium]|nr:cation transporter [Myxococcales bacterium]MCB9670077.1 cation transporter [Alphaproteobacteria bacterium]